MALGAEARDVIRSWEFLGDVTSRERLARELERQGVSLVRPSGEGLDARSAAGAPWHAVGRVFGARPRLVEQQPIHPIPTGRSYAATRRETPLHTDSQMWRGTMPGAQLMFCERPADTGGETLLADSWELLGSVETTDPELFRALFHSQRDIPFVFGNVRGTTVSRRGGALTFTHSPQPPGDPIAQRLAQELGRLTALRVVVRAGELLIVDNHRMLHGRTAFSGERRFTRLLAWLGTPLGRHARYESLAAEARCLEPAPPGPGSDAARQRAAVIEMLNGEPPGVLARRYGVLESELYRWRDHTFGSADDVPKEVIFQREGF